jgi:hypothetical protein
MAIVSHALGHFSGPMLAAVCPSSFPRPSRPCSHHVVTAGGWHFTFGVDVETVAWVVGDKAHPVEAELALAAHGGREGGRERHSGRRNAVPVGLGRIDTRHRGGVC